MPIPSYLGDRHALVSTLEVLRPLARRWTRTAADAEDLVQDTAERALRNLDRYQHGTNAVAWIRSIMYHLAVDGSRRSGCRATSPFDESLTAAPALDGEPEAWREVEWDEIDQAVGQLAEPVAGTFRLWISERLSYAEISRRQGIPMGTVSSRLMRGRLALRASIRVGPRDTPARLPDAA
jgi:RNA polymerase sigma-70 factor (ECF subfamily)